MSLTPEQKEARRFTLGASDIAAVVGLNPWKTLHDVWLEKMGLADEQDSSTTRAGELVEPIALQLYAEETGAEIAHFGAVVHPKQPWMSATPDFAVFGRPVVGEAKFVGWRVALHWGDGPEDVPDYYRPQAEWQMEVCSAEQCHFAVLVGGPDFRTYRVKRDPELAGMLIDIGGKFWRDHVIARRPPAVDGSAGAREMLRKLFPRHKLDLRPADPRATELVSEMIAARQALDEAEARKADIENRIREAIGDAEGWYSPSWLVTWKADKRGVRALKFKPKSEVAA